MDLELIGWIGSVLLAFCALPQAIKTYRDGHAEGLSLSFIAMWFFGEVLTLIYIYPAAQIPLIANYTANILIMLVIIKYKFFPTNKP